MDKLLQNYISSFNTHVGTKTTDIVLHEFLAKVYEFNFNALHTISEKRQDLGMDESIDCDVAAEEMMKVLESEKAILEGMIEENNSYGMDDLLRGLMNELEWLIGAAQGFVKEEEIEDETETEEPKEEKKKVILFSIK